MNSAYRAYLQSKEWSQIKLDLYQLRGKKCERCGSTNNLQVHHKHYRNIFKEEPDDLEILCNSCHRNEHGLNKKSKRVKLSPRFKDLKVKVKKKKKFAWLNKKDRKLQMKYNKLRSDGKIS